MTIKLTAPQLKQIIAEEAKKLHESKSKRPPTEDQLIDRLSEVKAREAKVRAIHEKAARELKKLAEAKDALSKRLLKSI